MQLFTAPLIKAFHMTTVPGFYASRTNGSLRPRTELDYYDELGLPRPERIGIFPPTGRGEHPDHKHVFFSAHETVIKGGRFAYIFDADLLISDMGATVRTNLLHAIYEIDWRVVNSVPIPDFEPPTHEELKAFSEIHANSFATLRSQLRNPSDNEIFRIIVTSSYKRFLYTGLREKSNERIFNNLRSEREQEYKVLAAYFEIDNPPAIESILDPTISDAAQKSNNDAITNYFRDDEAKAILKHHPRGWHRYCEIMVDRAVPISGGIGEIEKGETFLDQQ